MHRLKQESVELILQMQLLLLVKDVFIYHIEFQRRGCDILFEKDFFQTSVFARM